MNPAYAFHKTLIPHSTVELCASAFLSFDYPSNYNPEKSELQNLLSARSSKCPDLVVVRGTVLELFHIVRREKKQTTEESFVSENPNSSEQEWQLELFFETEMFGNIISVLPVRPPNMKRDFLMLSFKDAKVSYVMWDEDLATLSVVSLHYFEEEKLRSTETYHHKPILKVDPKQKCAVMMIYDKKLAVIPIRRYSGHRTRLEEDIDPTALENTKSTEQTGKSSSTIIDLSFFGIHNIKDYIFLTGYFEPTVLILFEPVRTWTGRLSLLKDTCVIAAFSLKDFLKQTFTGKNENTTPIIWKQEGIPYDAWKLVPVQLGGALVLCKNQLLYFNQNNKYGMYVNALGGSEATPRFPMHQAEIQIDLDRCSTLWISPEKLLISIRNGDLYLFQFFSDGRTVTSIRPEKVGSSVLTSSMTFLGNSLIFFGSRLGDSILFQFKETTKEDMVMMANKKLKTEQIELFPEDDLINVSKRDNNNNKKKNLDPVDDDELDLMIYSNTASDTSRLSSIKFSLQDTLNNNLGPISDFAICESYDLNTQSHTNVTGTRYTEIVTCSNYGKHGSICVLQEGVRPKVVKAIDVKSKGVWTGQKAGSVSGDWLFLSKVNTTLVFSTGKGIHEVKMSGFASATLLIQNVLAHKRLVRVTAKEVILLNSDDLSVVNTLEFHDHQITGASIMDPYILVFFGKEKKMSLIQTALNRLSIQNTFPNLDKISACSLFEIDPLLFKVTPKQTPIPTNENPQESKTELDAEDEELYGASSKSEPQSNQNNAPSKSELDDEDEELYGTSYAESKDTKIEKSEKEEEIDAFFQRSEEAKLPVAFVFVEDGRIHLRFVSDPETDIWTAPAVQRGFKNLFYQTDNLKEKKETQEFFVTVAADTIADPVVVEVSISQLDESRFPHLFVKLKNILGLRTDTKDLYIYQCYQNPLRGTISWKKVEHKAKIEPLSQTPFSYPLCHAFSNISGRRGCFISGKNPHWGMLEKGYLRFFPMNVEPKGVSHFTSFDINMAPESFIYLTDNHLKISNLNSPMSYDSKWVFRKFSIRCTPHKIAFFPDSCTIAVVVSNKYRRVAEDVPEGYRSLNNQEFYPHDDKFELRLYTFNSPQKPGELKLLDRYAFEPTEHVLAMKITYLRSNQVNGLKEYLVVGTSLVQGEDHQVRGNAVIFEIINPQASQMVENSEYSSEDFTPTLKRALLSPQKGAVIQLCGLDGLLALAVGPKVVLHDFSNGIDLLGIAFYDTNVFITEMASVKNYLLVSDIHKSIIWLRWKESAKQFILFAKDYNPLNAYQCDFLFQDQALHFLTADSNKNIQLFLFAPKSLESRGGQMLLCRADFHIGSAIQKFRHIRAFNDKSKSSNIYVTIDGGLGYVTPIDEIGFKRLLALQSKLNTGIAHFAGLNPKSFRSMKDVFKHYRNTHHQILDGDLLSKYPRLEWKEQRKLAQQIGTSPNQILTNFVDITKSTEGFF